MQSPVFLVNSRLGHFSATPSGSTREVLHPNGVPLLPKLRGEFAEFLSERSLTRLGILSLSTCVGLRYGQIRVSLEVFLGSVESTSNLPPKLPAWLSSALMTSRICLRSPPKSPPRIPIPSMPILLRHPIVQTSLTWRRNINLLSIAYAVRPRLRTRLTLSGRAFLRNP